MAKKVRMPKPPLSARRREFTEEFRREAVQMLLDGHSAASVAERLGLAGTNLLYRWKRDQLERTGPVATSLEARGPGVGNRVAPRRARTRHLKKSVGHFRPARVADVYAAIAAIVQETAALDGVGLRGPGGVPVGVLRLARRRTIVP